MRFDDIVPVQDKLCHQAHRWIKDEDLRSPLGGFLRTVTNRSRGIVVGMMHSSLWDCCIPRPKILSHSLNGQFSRACKVKRRPHDPLSRFETPQLQVMQGKTIKRHFTNHHVRTRKNVTTAATEPEKRTCSKLRLDR